MSLFDSCIEVFLVLTCGCCCLSCSQTNNLWCLLKAPGGDTNYRVRSSSGMCCSCKRAMSDDDFERTVEQLYAPGTGPKPYDSTGNGNATHVVELQPTSRRTRRSGEDQRDADGNVASQPRPRPSMDARRPPSRSENHNQDQDQPVPSEGDRERVILESHRDAKARTRDWIAQQSKSMDASADSSMNRDANAPARAPGSGTAHRAHQSESHVATQQPQRLPEAHARAQPPADGFVLPDLNVRGDGSLGRVSAWNHGDSGMGVGGGAPVRERGAIPAALTPGRTQNSAPSQLPFDLGPVSGLGPATTQPGAPSESSPSSNLKEDGSAAV
ncbi:hypothetical protein GSI_09146 [Ganoderma sinense ZZ0214-1]|uniref:Transporter n=1 Tax=Ganoderma sinense ZZ0214-1 TaxID=1077348 RepID=A0A2G8S6D3_9APHY|nr:hypothetical protein GSI_09146 [Ganoderma sinense ZZ0214-1]